MRSSTGEADTEEQAPNPPPPHYEGSRQIFRGVVAWWGKLAGKGQVTERGPQLSFAMVTVKLSDIKPLYGALCPGSYVVYQKDCQGLFNFWVEAGPYVL